MNKSVRIKLENNVGMITLARPDTGNAFDKEMFDGVRVAVEHYAQLKDAVVIGITGEGKNFSVGGDINKMAGFDFLTEDLMSASRAMIKAILDCPKPVIAVVNGAAAGAGMALALACDYRILDEKSKFIAAFSNVGLSGDTGCMYFLSRYVGQGKAFELMSLSMPVSAKAAKDLGLATIVAGEGKLDSTGKEFVERLKERPLQVIGRQKALLNKKLSHEFDAYSEMEAKLLIESAGSGEHREAVTAFLEKRKPDFSVK